MNCSSFFLDDHGLYKIVGMKKFQVPSVSSFSEDMRTLVDGCCLLRSICIDSQNKYKVSMVKKLNKIDGFTHELKEKECSS